VTVWGEYEELIDDRNQMLGMEIMADRLAPFIISETVSPTHNFSKSPLIVEKEKKAVVYRIRIAEKTGRFEKA
jgi:hypothetical protein